MAIGPTIETERLVLRPQIPEDFDAWAAVMADVEASGFIGGPQPRAVAWRGFTSMTGSWIVRGYAMFSVIEKTTGDWIGRIGPWYPEGWPGREVGWGLVRSAWGKGYATEATVVCMDYAFDELGWDDVIHSIDPKNTPSQRLAERLGSTNRGPGRLPEPFEDKVIDIWGQTREEWARNRQQFLGGG